MKKPDLHIKILFFNARLHYYRYKFLKISKKIVVPLFGAAYAALNKGTTILY